LQHPLLAREIDEADPVLFLVALEPRDELQSLVHELDQRAVEVGDLSPHSEDVRILGRGDGRILGRAHAPSSR
jgi:hypothetical protein